MPSRRRKKALLAIALIVYRYVATAIVWLWRVDGVRPDRWDVVGSAVAIIGMAVIMFGPRGQVA